MSKPVEIDVFYPIPEGWGICSSCEMMMAQADMGEPPQERGLDEYPPEIREEFQRLSALIYGLADNYQDKVRIHVWDPRSLQGLLKSIRYGVRRYPTFIVDKKKKLTGWDREKLEEHIQSADNFGDSAI